MMTGRVFAGVHQLAVKASPERVEYCIQVGIRQDHRSEPVRYRVFVEQVRLLRSAAMP